MPPIEATSVRKGTTAEWADVDASDGAAAPTLDAGEVAVDLTTGQIAVSPADDSLLSALLKHRPVKITAVVLVAGTKLTADTSIKAGTVIIPVLRTLGTITVPKAVACVARVVDTSFTITSADNTDTSTYDVLIIQP